jgi:hypothetical protein
MLRKHLKESGSRRWSPHHVWWYRDTREAKVSSDWVRHYLPFIMLLKLIQKSDCVYHYYFIHMSIFSSILSLDDRSHTVKWMGLREKRILQVHHGACFFARIYNICSQKCVVSKVLSRIDAQRSSPLVLLLSHPFHVVWWMYSIMASSEQYDIVKWIQKEIFINEFKRKYLWRLFFLISYPVGGPVTCVRLFCTRWWIQQIEFMTPVPGSPEASSSIFLEAVPAQQPRDGPK